MSNLLSQPVINRRKRNKHLGKFFNNRIQDRLLSSSHKCSINLHHKLDKTLRHNSLFNLRPYSSSSSIRVVFPMAISNNNNLDRPQSPLAFQRRLCSDRVQQQNPPALLLITNNFFRISRFQQRISNNPTPGNKVCPPLPLASSQVDTGELLDKHTLNNNNNKCFLNKPEVSAELKNHHR